MNTTVKRGMRFFMQRVVLFGAAIIGFSIGTNLPAEASVPDTQGAVHACYQTSGLLAAGQARIIDSATQSCNANETAVNVAKASTGDFLSTLANSDFTGVNFAYRNFVGQDLHGGTFSSSNLNGADFTSADLSSSTFSTTSDLSNYLLSRSSVFTNTNFNNTVLSNNIDFTNATFNGATFDNTVFSYASITGGDFHQANITDAILDGVFDGSDFNGVDFRVAQNAAGHFANANLSNAIFNGLNLGGGQFTDATTLSGAHFNGATLSGTIFRLSPLHSVDFTNVHFQNADLQATDFSGSTLTGVTWSNTLCPDGTNSDSHGNTCTFHLVPLG